MSQIIAIVYPDMSKAAEVMATLPRLQVSHLIELDDACYVTRDEKGKILLHQGHKHTAAGAIGGAFWGTLLEMIFFTALGGVALGAAAGPITGKLSDVGIKDDFMKSLAKEMTPSSTAIFMLLRQ